MTRISSRMTFFYKRVFPFFFIGFSVLFVLIGVLTHGKNAPPAALIVIVPVLMMAVGFTLFKKLIGNLMDEVYDCGDHLIIRNDRQEDKIGLNEISNISYAFIQNPQCVTLSVRRMTKFGNEISFSPTAPALRTPFYKSPIVKDLIDRVDRTRIYQ